MHPTVPQDKVDQLGDVDLGAHLFLSSYALEMADEQNNANNGAIISLCWLVPAKEGGWRCNQKHCRTAERILRLFLLWIFLLMHLLNLMCLLFC